MNTLDKLLPQDLYHSYVVEGDTFATSEELIALLKNRGLITADSHNLFWGKYDSFSVADSQEIRIWHNERPSKKGDKKICILSASFINHDAERTLLKMIEEPKDDTHFFIVVPDASALLDTIRSRVHVIKLSHYGDKDWEVKAQEFINKDLKSRFDIIDKLIKLYKNDEGNNNLRAQAIKFLNELEKILFEKFKNNKNDPKISLALREIEEKRVFLNYPGASVKMILEHLALMV